MFAIRRRVFLSLVLLSGLGACTLPEAKNAPPADMGNFSLGYNVVLAKDPVIGPLSRTADEGTWQTVIKDEIAKRFSGYEGDKLYHLGISVEAYVLALPGVPLVISPKSVLIFKVTAWDDAAGKKLNEEPKQITVLESVSKKTVIGSGLTQTKEQQQRNLAVNAARAVQDWLLKNPEWFGLPADKAATATTVIPDATADTKVVPDTKPADVPAN